MQTKFAHLLNLTDFRFSAVGIAMGVWGHPYPHPRKTEGVARGWGHKKQLLSGANQAHRLTAVTVVGALRKQKIGEHAVRVDAIAVRSRPVEAAAAHIADRSPIAVASGRQEDGTVQLQGTPLRGAYHIAAEARVVYVGVAQAVVARAPVVGQQYHAVHVVHIGLGIADARCGAACVENVAPFSIGRRAPTAVLRVATVADGIVTPVGLASLVVEIVGVATVGVVVIRGVCCPGLIGSFVVVVAARAPTEQVAVDSFAGAALAIITEIIPLVICKSPVWRCRAANILQIPFREPHHLGC